MKKIYKTDLGTLIFIGLGVPFLLGITILAFFIITDSPLWVKIISPIVTIFSIFFFLAMLKYDIVITDESISTKIPLLSFLNNYQTMKFEEIQEIYNVLTPFPEMPIVFLRSRDKKLISLMIGFGLPWDALLDILERLPKDVKINFEPDLWKRIKRPLTNDKVRKINIIATIVIVLAVAWFLYFLLSIFKLHRIPFPINFFLGRDA